MNFLTQASCAPCKFIFWQKLSCYSAYTWCSVPLKEPDCITLIYAEEFILGDCHLDVEKVIISRYQLYFLADVVAGFLLMRLAFN